MDFKLAQQDMDHAYFAGGPGVFASGLVWAAAAVMSYFMTNVEGMLTLLFAGTIIHPLGLLFAKLLKRPAKHSKGNPLATVAIENLFILFIGLFIAFVIAMKEPNWFFPIMLMVIGVRYFGFQSLYGNKLYWALALVLVISGGITFIVKAEPWLAACIGAAIELIFAIILVLTPSPFAKMVEQSQLD